MISFFSNYNKPFKNYLAIAFLLPALANAEVYKWTDENGNIHYSDIKPNTQNSEKLKISTSKTSQTRKNVKEEAQQLGAKKQQELQAQANKLDTDTKKRELEAQCDGLRANLKKIEENSRIKVSEGDSTRYLNPEEIQAQKETIRQQLDAHC